MELRRVETEVNDISTSYESLRCKRLVLTSSSLSSSSHESNDTELCNLSDLPSLVDISERFFLKEKNDDGNDDGGATAGGEENTNNGNDAKTDKPVVPDSTATNTCEMDVDGGNTNENNEVIEINIRDALNELESFRSRLSGLEPKTNRFRKRLTERDPVTDAPRYGEKTMVRVKKIIDAYDALIIALKLAFGEKICNDDNDDDAGGESIQIQNNETVAIVDEIKRAIKDEEETQKRTQLDALSAAEAQEAKRQKEAAIAAERERLEQEQAEAARKKEEAELAQQAEEARRLRIESERRAEEEAREAERAFVASIPKGGDGVRVQINAVREACASSDSSGKDWNTAIGALHTIFTQIAAHPEEPKFRRIRRDHPKFTEDIGRHPGGKEVLIAAGFRLDTIEGVKCFFSKEPNIEHDMDGWSDWFNGLKETLEIIEEEMMK